MKRASVACILRGREALFIRRSQRANDKWSGQVAFPGGRQEDQDKNDDLATCVREVREELGLDLKEPGFRLLGKGPEMSLIEKGSRGLTVVCFVFEWPTSMHKKFHFLDERGVLASGSTDEERPFQAFPRLQPSAREVASCGWASLDELAQAPLMPLNLILQPHLLGVPSLLEKYAQFAGFDKIVFPGIQLNMLDQIGGGDFVLWGLTLRMVERLIDLPALKLYHPSKYLCRIEHRFQDAYLKDVLWTMIVGRWFDRDHLSAAMRFYFWALHSAALGTAVLAYSSKL